MAFSKEEREQFLAEPHVGALSVVERADRAPLVVPLWYAYEPGGQLRVHTGTHSRKARAIRAAGRFSLLVQRTTPTVRYVAVEGPVTGTNAVDRESTRQMAARYLPAEAVAGYVDYEHTELDAHIAIDMQPQHWISADLGTA